MERVPNAWVMVASAEDYKALTLPERRYMVSKALAKGLDSSLPAKE